MEKKTFGPTTWVLGDRGLLEPHATSQAKLINLRVHPNGYLVPRQPWQDGDISFFSADFPAATTSFQAGWYDIGDGSYTTGVLAVSPTDISFQTLDGTQIAAKNGVGGLPTTMVKNAWTWKAEGHQWGFNEWILTLKVPGTNIVPYVDTVDAKTDLLATIFGGLNSIEVYGSVLHQSRAFYWGAYVETSNVFDYAGSAALEATTSRTRKNELWYSDPNDYGTFTDETQFLRFDFDIAGAFSIGSSLFVWGDNGDWWVLQGRGDPEDGTFNYLGRFRIPAIGQQPVLMGDTGIFISSDDLTIVTFNEQGEFDQTGQQIYGLDNTATRYASSADMTQQTSSSVMNTVLIGDSQARNNGVIHRHRWNGIWTEENWDTLPITAITEDYEILSLPEENMEILLVRNFGTGNWEAFQRSASVDIHVASSNDPYETDMTSEIHLPLIVDPSDMVRVERVVIDITASNPSGVNDPTASVAVTMGSNIDHAFQMGPITAIDQDILDGSATEPPPLTRLEFTPTGMQPFTHRAEVKITDMRYVSVEQVTVHYSVDGGEQLA